MPLFPRLASVGLVALLLSGSACQRAPYQAQARLAPVTAQPVSGQLAANAAVEATIAPYHQKVEETMNQVLGTAPVAIVKGDGESPLANFVADLQRERASRELRQPVDLGVMSKGGLRAPLPAGPITLGSVFELMPFENELVVLDAPGSVVEQLFTYAARVKMAVSGAVYTVTPEGKPTQIMIGGKPFDASRTYTIAISDYLAGGGDQMVFFKPLAPRKTGVLLRSAISEHIQKLTKAGRPVEARVEGRVKF